MAECWGIWESRRGPCGTVSCLSYENSRTRRGKVDLGIGILGLPCLMRCEACPFFLIKQKTPRKCNRITKHTTYKCMKIRRRWILKKCLLLMRERVDEEKSNKG